MESARPQQASPTPIRLESRFALALIALAGLGLAAAAAFTSIPLPPCLFRLATGVPCAGCGMTRSVAALLHGDLVLSFRYHPLGPVLLLGALGCLVAPLLPTDRVRLPNQRTIALTAFVLLVGVWLARIVLFLAGNRFFLW
jgi:hypothetical protein